jgi:hypothetical protein
MNAGLPLHIGRFLGLVIPDTAKVDLKVDGQRLNSPLNFTLQFRETPVHGLQFTL